MVFMMAVVWLPLLFIVWWAVRQFGQPGGSGGGDQGRLGDEVDAREMARRPYARGELSRERFLEIIADLQGSSDSKGGEQHART